MKCVLIVTWFPIISIISWFIVFVQAFNVVISNSFNFTCEADFLLDSIKGGISRFWKRKHKKWMDIEIKWMSVYHSWRATKCFTKNKVQLMNERQGSTKNECTVHKSKYKAFVISRKQHCSSRQSKPSVTHMRSGIKAASASVFRHSHLALSSAGKLF